MTDKANEQNKAEKPESPGRKDQAGSSRKVVVTRRDVPPPSGKQGIHPRRSAPIVPTREERTQEQSGDDSETSS